MDVQALIAAGALMLAVLAVVIFWMKAVNKLFNGGKNNGSEKKDN